LTGAHYFVGAALLTFPERSSGLTNGRAVDHQASVVGSDVLDK